jgi:hypothetical protein
MVLMYLRRNITSNSSIPTKNNLMGPSVAGGPGNWAPEDVWNTGFLDDYKDNLKYITVEQCVFASSSPMCRLTCL